MRCFEKLVKSKFLANISAELKLARQTMLSTSNSSLVPVLLYSRKERKNLYDDYVYYYYFLEEIQQSVVEPTHEKSIIYYVKYENVLFIYSADKSQVDDAIRYSYNVNGDIPLCRSRHKIANTTIYTALMDTRIRFEPISPN